MSAESGNLILSGKLFYSDGAATAKSLSLRQVCSRGSLTKQHLGGGTQPTNWDVVLELISQVYGKGPVQSLETSTIMLNWTRCAMGSQCRDLSTGVIGSLTPVLVMSHAALLHMHCTLRSCVVGSISNNELLVSSREIMKACAKNTVAAC